MVDALVTQPHHADHLLPIWHALAPRIRGRLWVGHDEQMRAHVAKFGFEANYGIPPPSDVPVLVASGNELVAVKYAILCEHGVGQTYEGVEHCCWPGGPSRENVILFLCPNERVAQANRARYPDTPCAVVGSPHVESLRRLPPYPLAEPRIALSTHWDAGHLVPELRSGWAWFESVYEKLCRERPDAFVIHGHPRFQNYTAWKAREWGVEFVASFAELVSRAWCYVTDNSSTLYEWAALDRPVVAVSPPWYRESVEHGLRFWDMADVGEHVTDPAELEGALYMALADLTPQRQRRQMIMRALFGQDLSAGASARAAKAIAEVLA